ncbi:MAG: helix-turn-helix domain-containing protein, partial [Bacteroidota bacterium]
NLLVQIAESAQIYLHEKQPFLKPGYTLQELSEDIQSSPVLTSKAINRVLKTNFNELMNEQRVKHFIRLARLERSEHLTLWGIAQEAGFGNKVTFYKAFKKQMGTTPKVYLANTARTS